MLNELTLPNTWDLQADVVVIGGGNAGFSAATRAAQAGADTVVLEQQSTPFGSLAVFHGKHVTFAGTEFQKRNGIDDSPEKYFQDAQEYSHGDADLWHAYVDKHLEAYDFCLGIGLKPAELWRLPGHSVPRGVFFEGGGPRMLELLQAAAEREGVRLYCGHKAQRLIVDLGANRIAGVVVEHDGKTVNCRAKKAVVIASGGFGNNPDMVEEYRGYTYATHCVPVMRGHSGEGIRMAMSIGAATRNIGTAAIASIPCDANTKALGSLVVTHCLCGAILVNEQAQRFVNESRPKLGGAPKNPFIGEIAFRQPGTYIYTIYDEKIRKNISLVEWSAFHVYEGESMRDIANQLGLDPQVLAATVEQYNSDIGAYGRDQAFGRDHLEVPPGAPLLTIDQAPFYAIKGISSLSSFKGGLRINPEAQVLDLYGSVIPGLYAAGETTGGWFREGCYIDGTMTSMSFTMGLLAGEGAAAER